MEFSDVVRRRRMVRSFDPSREVSAPVLDGVLDAAVRAPTAGFSQGIELLVLQSAEERERFWAATTSGSPDRWLRGMRTAPVLLVVLADEDRYRRRYAERDKASAAQDPDRWSAPFWYVDAGMAAHAVLLGAVDAGLGACFFGIPAGRVAEVRDVFGVPGTIRPVGVVAVGYAGAGQGSAGSARRARRPRAEVVHRGRWHGGG